MKGNSANGIFKFMISVTGGHGDYLPQAPRNLATPLTAGAILCF
jgi:hypothetical protein